MFNVAEVSKWSGFDDQRHGGGNWRPRSIWTWNAAAMAVHDVRSRLAAVRMPAGLGIGK
jgi:hypothetical protein